MPDEGKGIRLESSLDWHVYHTKIQPSLVPNIKKNPIIKLVMLDEFVDDNGDGDYSVVPHKLSARVDPESREILAKYLSEQGDSPDHLNLISQSPRNAWMRDGRQNPPPLPTSYMLHPKAGEGVTVFHIDTGINPDHPVRYCCQNPSNKHLMFRVI